MTLRAQTMPWSTVIYQNGLQEMKSSATAVDSEHGITSIDVDVTEIESVAKDIIKSLLRDYRSPR